MSVIRVSNISNLNQTSGPVISGIVTSTGSGYATLPSGSNAERVGIESGSLRYNNTSKLLEFYDGTEWRFILPADQPANATGIFGGGIVRNYESVDDMKYVTISSLGDAQLFGQMTVDKAGLGGCASRTRGIFAGGYISGNTLSGPYTLINTMDYVTISTKGNAIDFGDLNTANRQYVGGCSSSTRGIFAGGQTSVPISTFTSNIQYITIASISNSISFGSLSSSRFVCNSAGSDSTRGVFAGGALVGTPSNTVTTTIDYITIAATPPSTAITFGSLSKGNSDMSACSSSTRIVFGGGKISRNPSSDSSCGTLEYVTTQSTGNSIYFGKLIDTANFLAACSSSTRGVYQEFTPKTLTEDMSYINIATTGDAMYFGQHYNGGYIYGTGGFSNDHGGLQ